MKTKALVLDIDGTLTNTVATEKLHPPQKQPFWLS